MRREGDALVFPAGDKFLGSLSVEQNVVPGGHESLRRVVTATADDGSLAAVLVLYFTKDSSLATIE